MFIRGPPPPLHNTNNYLVGTRNHCVGQLSCKNYTEPLCGLIHLKKLLENNFKGPMFIRGPPPSSQHNNHCVGIRNHCVGQFSCKNYTEPLCGSIHLKKLLENNLRVPGFPPPPLAQQTITVWPYETTMDTRNHCVGQSPLKTTGKKL